MRLMVVLIALFVVGTAVVAQDQLSAIPALASQLPIKPLQTTGVEVLQVDWTQIAAMLTVFGGISAIIQLILTRLIVQPQVTRAVEHASENFQKWAYREFPTKLEFQRHTDDIQNLGDAVEACVLNQAKDHEKLGIVRDRVTSLEFRAGLNSK